MKELNLAFLPIEERVFSLDNPTAYNDYYGGKMTEKKLDEIAEQLVSQFSYIFVAYQYYSSDIPFVNFSIMYRLRRSNNSFNACRYYHRLS